MTSIKKYIYQEKLLLALLKIIIKLELELLVWLYDFKIWFDLEASDIKKTIKITRMITCSAGSSEKILTAY